MRLEEKIRLVWDNSVDLSNNMPIKRIRLIDVASGSSKHSPKIESTDTNDQLYKFMIDNPTNYDISANVVQIRLRDEAYTELPGSSNYNQNDALNQIFNEIIGWSKYMVDIVPLNYKPFRFLGDMDNAQPNTTPNMAFNTSNTGNDRLYLSPWKVISDQDESTVNALFLKEGSITYSIESTGDLSYNVLVPLSSSDPSNSFILVSSGDATQANKPILLGNIRDPVPGKLNVQVGTKNKPGISTDTVGRPAPVTLGQGNHFISDYWQWNKRLFDIQKIYPTVTDTSYNKMVNQVKLAAIIDIINIKLDIQVVLLNTAYNETDQVNIPYPDNPINTDITNKITIVGGGNVAPPINTEGVVLDISINPSPIEEIPDETPWTGGYAFPPSGDISGGGGIIPPQGDVTENITLYELFGAKGTYPSRVTDSSRRRWNNLYNMNITGADPSSNPNPELCNVNYRGLNATPKTIIVNCVEIPTLYQSNVGNMLNSANTIITIEWPKHYFKPEQGETLWTVTRTDAQTLESKTILNQKNVGVTGNVYRFQDTNIRIYDKYIYKVSGIFSWTPSTYNPNNRNLTIPVGSFTTDTTLICINNQFPYGRYNTTSTNLKLYRPLLIRSAGGQCDKVDETGNTSGNCVGGVCSGLVNGKMQNLYNPGRSVGGTRNIYANTSDQMSQKQVYVLLAKSNVLYINCLLA